MINVLNVIYGLGTGGVEKILMDTIKNTSEKVNHSIMVWSSERNIYKEYIQSNNIDVIKTPQIDSGLNIFKNYKFVYEYMNTNKNNIDIVHYYGGSLNYYIPVIVANKLNIPIILHSHSSQSSNPKLTKTHKLISKWHNKKGHSYNIGCSYEAGKWMFGDDNFKVLLNGIDIDKYKKGYQIGKEKKNNLFSDGSTVIGNFGRFNRNKNQKYLIRLLADLHKKGHTEFRLLLIGEGELEDNLKEQSKILKIDKFVKILSFQTNLEVYYGMIDVFIMPSLSEGLPLVLIEAQVAGVPVLVSDTVDEKIKTNSNLVFFNQQDSFEKVEQMLLNLIEEGHQNSSLYGTEYDLNTMSENIYKIYFDIINDTSKAH